MGKGDKWAMVKTGVSRLSWGSNVLSRSSPYINDPGHRNPSGTDLTSRTSKKSAIECVEEGKPRARILDMISVDTCQTPGPNSETREALNTVHSNKILKYKSSMG